jgi:hypothetical protein
VNETPTEQLERLRRAEQFALEEVKRRVEAGLIPARPGRYEVTVCEEVEVDVRA